MNGSIRGGRTWDVSLFRLLSIDVQLEIVVGMNSSMGLWLELS